MSSIPQNHCDENELIDCVQRFFSRHHVGKLLAKCNGMKEKGVSPVSLLRPDFATCFILTIEKNVENTAFGLYFFTFMI